MLVFRTKLTASGRIVIPSKCREALHLSVGDEIIIKVAGDKAHFYSLPYAIKQTRAFVKKRNKKKLKLTELLIKEPKQ